MTVRRNLTDSEKQLVLEKHGRKCFVNDHSIPDGETVEFHHLKAYSEGGETTTDNIVPVCSEHHRRMRTMSVEEFRDRLELEQFFQAGEQPKRMSHILEAKCPSGIGKELGWEIGDGAGRIALHFASGRDADFHLYDCPTTGYKFFYALVPIEHLSNDVELQPRPLNESRVWQLYKHLKSNTQLAAAVCRLEGKRILLFDGQHKTAAQVWLGRKEVECKVFVEPDASRLKETNLDAHHTLRQMSFYSSILMRKFGDIFRDDWEDYMSLPGQKSEKGFVEYLMTKKEKTKAEAISEIRLAMYEDLFGQASGNRLSNFIAPENKTKKFPLTHNLVRKSLLHDFFVDPPLSIEFDSEDDKRNLERDNLIRFMNILAEETLEGKWRPETNDNTHQKVVRFYFAGATKGWSQLLKGVVANLLNLFTDTERERIFFREISDDKFEEIRRRIKRLFEHRVWSDPNPEVGTRLRINDANETLRLMAEHGLNSEYLIVVPGR